MASRISILAKRRLLPITRQVFPMRRAFNTQGEPESILKRLEARTNNLEDHSSYLTRQIGLMQRPQESIAERVSILNKLVDIQEDTKNILGNIKTEKDSTDLSIKILQGQNEAKCTMEALDTRTTALETNVNTLHTAQEQGLSTLEELKVRTGTIEEQTAAVKSGQQRTKHLLEALKTTMSTNEYKIQRNSKDIAENYGISRDSDRDLSKRLTNIVNEIQKTKAESHLTIQQIKNDANDNMCKVKDALNLTIQQVKNDANDNMCKVKDALNLTIQQVKNGANDNMCRVKDTLNLTIQQVKNDANDNMCKVKDALNLTIQQVENGANDNIRDTETDIWNRIYEIEKILAGHGIRCDTSERPTVSSRFFRWFWDGPAPYITGGMMFILYQLYIIKR